MSDAYVIETAGVTAGIVVAERSFVRFYASEAAFYPLDGKQFRNVRTARNAVTELQKARAKVAARGTRFPYRRAA